MKKLWLLVICGFSLNAQKPEVTVVGFDLHGCAFDFSAAKFCGAAYKFFSKNPYNLTLLNPLAAYRVYNVMKRVPKTAEHVFDTLSKDYYPWLAASHDDFLDLCNIYVPNKAMFALIGKLNQKGIVTAVCSNIGEKAYGKFSKEYPEEFAQFKVITISRSEFGYCRKPSPEFFKRFKQDCYDALGTENIRFIFTDDKAKNVKAADQMGITGIKFKNAQQFSDELEKFCNF